MTLPDWPGPVLLRLKKKITPHRNYQQARARLNNALLVRQPGECICFTGPSRAGKTTIAEQTVALHNPAGASTNLIRRPAALIKVRNKGDRGNFTTKTFYLNALKSIRHPFFSVHGEDLFENADRIRRMNNEPNDILADILENALEVLGIRYLLIDEAHHLKYIVGGDKSACQVLESLKTLAEAIGCVIVFVGAYPILDVLRLAPHILGREYLVHLPRYRSESMSDLVAFEQALQWFSEGIEFENGVESLRDWNEFLLGGSLGVPGLLSAWIRDGISEMLSRGDGLLRMDHMRFSQKRSADQKEILAEIEAGEESLAGWEYPSAEWPSEEQEKPAAAKKTKKGNRPFESKPKRRKAGGRG